MLTLSAERLARTASAIFEATGMPLPVEAPFVSDFATTARPVGAMIPS